MKKISLLCLIMSLLLTSCSQDDIVMFGSVYGVVRDSATGDGIRNAAVTISPGNYTYTTGSDGQFQFSDLEAGTYTIHCVANGYNANSRQLTIYAGGNSNCDFLMTKQSSVVNVSISTNSIDFGTSSTEEVFSITNTGNTGTVSWNISSPSAQWLSVTPSQGSIAQGKSSSVTVRVDRSKVTKDETSYLIINVAGGSISVAVHIRYNGNNSGGGNNSKGEAALGLNTNTLDFGTTESELTLLVANMEEATANLRWEIGNDYPNYLSLSMQSGELEPGYYNTVIVRLDRNKITSNIDTKLKLYDLADNYEYYYPIAVKATMVTKEDYSSAKITTESCDGFEFKITSCKRSGTTVLMEYTLTNNNSYMAYWVIGSSYCYASDNLYNTYDYKQLKYSLSTISGSYGSYISNAPVAAKQTVKGTIAVKSVDETAKIISIYLVYASIYNNDDRKYMDNPKVYFENIPIY